MEEFVAVHKDEDSISVCFYIERDKPMEIGGRMQEINEEAYMNGYNWGAFWDYYLEKNEPDIFDALESDPEAGMYCAYFDLTEENERLAERFAEIIQRMLREPEELYRILREEGDEIEWD